MEVLNINLKLLWFALVWKTIYIMKVYVLYRQPVDDPIEIFGFFSTKEKAEKELMDYNIIMMVDFGLKIKEVEMDKIISF